MNRWSGVWQFLDNLAGFFACLVIVTAIALLCVAIGATLAGCACLL
jgi:hypothetical protein